MTKIGRLRSTLDRHWPISANIGQNWANFVPLSSEAVPNSLHSESQAQELICETVMAELPKRMSLTLNLDHGLVKVNLVAMCAEPLRFSPTRVARVRMRIAMRQTSMACLHSIHGYADSQRIHSNRSSSDGSAM